MRTRSTTLFNYTSSATSYDSPGCPPVYTGHNWTYTNIGVKSIDDCVTPRYGLVLKSGGVLPYLPVTISTTTTVVNSKLSYTVNKTTSPACVVSYGEWLLPDTFWTIPAMPSIDSTAISYVTNAAIASAKSETFDALTAAAELKKTSDMIANRMSRVFLIAERNAKRALREKGIARQIAVFNSLWLEARYGWRPLVYDISNGCQQLRKKRSIRNEGHSSTATDLAAFTTKNTDGVAGRIIGTCTRSGTRTYRGFALANGDFGANAGGFQPFRTAWELVPFSFVVDWFFDIGSFISAATPIPGVDVPASGYSIHDSWSLVQDVSVVLKPGAVGYSVTTNYSGRYTKEANTYSRYPSGVSIPRLFPRLNTLKLVDIGSLVLQRALPLRRFIPKRL